MLDRFLKPDSQEYRTYLKRAAELGDERATNEIAQKEREDAAALAAYYRRQNESIYNNVAPAYNPPPPDHSPSKKDGNWISRCCTIL